jgi:hypothetical protein
MPVEAGVKVTLARKSETGEAVSRSFPLKDFQSKNVPDSPEFWEDVLMEIIKFHLRPDTRQKTLPTDDEAHAAGTPPESLGEKERKKAAKGSKPKPGEESGEEKK